MTCWALYNEIDPYAAEWLENLIAAGHIAPGIVDRRSIVDVQSDGLDEFTQIHWFAGIGGWSLALRRAGFPDDHPIWSASLPCQPFSAAGQQKAMNDDRHLWPIFHNLVRECRPAKIIGEQVSSKPALAWWDVVSNDLQISEYAVGAIDTSVASIGGPHIRQRLYWVAHARSAASERDTGGLHSPQEGVGSEGQFDGSLNVGPEHGGSALHGMARARSAASERGEECALGSGQRVGDGTQGRAAGYVDGGEPSGLAHADSGDRAQVRRPATYDRETHSAGARARDGYDRPNDEQPRLVRGDVAAERLADSQRLRQSGQTLPETGRRSSLGIEGRDSPNRPNPLHGPWRDADWLYCTDGKWRPIEPGASALAHGLPRGMGKISTGLEQLADLAGCDARSLRDAKRYRVGSLKGYGNAICIAQAEGFIRAALL